MNPLLYETKLAQGFTILTIKALLSNLLLFITYDYFQDWTVSENSYSMEHHPHIR